MDNQNIKKIEEQTETLQRIADDYSLSQEQFFDLNSEVGKVLTKKTRASNLAQQISDRVGVETQIAEKISAQIQEHILQELGAVSRKIPQKKSSIETILAGQAWRDKAQEIADRYGIRLEHRDDFELAIEQAAHGTEQNLEQSLARTLGITEDKSAKLTDAVEQKILIPIRNHIGGEKRALIQKDALIRAEKPKEHRPVPAGHISDEHPKNSSPAPQENRPLTESEKLDRMQILRDIEHPTTTAPRMKETGAPAQPTPQQSQKLAATESSLEGERSRPADEPPQTRPQPQPQPFDKLRVTEQQPQAQKESPLLKTIKQAQTDAPKETPANPPQGIVDQKMNTPQKPVQRPQTNRPNTSSQKSDPYREPPVS